MLAKAYSAALHGVDGYLVEVEVDITNGLPGFEIVGLPDAAIREAKERVRSAIKNSGMEFPVRRITVNLAPADLRKSGPSFDLPIAIAIMMASDQLPHMATEEWVIVGELALDGSVRPVTGILPVALAARGQGMKRIIVPADNGPEASIVGDIDVFGVSSLIEAVQFLTGEVTLSPTYPAPKTEDEVPAYVDFSDIKGQFHAKRALEIAAAGGHNILFMGPPGSGKTMLAMALAGILPPLSPEESIEVTKIFSIAGQLPPGRGLLKKRPFRKPHHNITEVALVGGGKIPRPGEITMAHHGVLFLDELPEFGRQILDNLREPLEEGKITIARANSSLTYPARFQFVAGMNPCICGFYGDPVHPCSCTDEQVKRYRSRVSGPLLDRIDIHVEVPRPSIAELQSPVEPEPSAIVRTRVLKAREVQSQRFSGQAIHTNAEMDSRQLRRFCTLDQETKDFLQTNFDRLYLSARAYARLLKVARTIADLEEAPIIKLRHVAEALQYRIASFK